jgi:very-short-patch-repair endonuclease
MQISYKKKTYLQDKYEHMFFPILQQILKEDSNDMVVLPQVQLGRIVDMTCQPFASKCKYYLHHGMNQLSFDFVLFNKSLTPLLAVELDGISHGQIRRVSRDQFVEQVCSEAGLPLLRVPVQENYDIEELRKQIKLKLKESTPALIAKE